VSKIILYELNEVPFRVLDCFCEQHPESAFAKKLNRCRQYVTISEDRPPLSPWVTWPSMHRGVTAERHGIRFFGQDLREPDRSYPPIWRITAANGVRTAVCGSLHSYPIPAGDRFAFYMPDTFAKSAESFPEFLTAFQAFNLKMARQSPRNVSKAIPIRSALRVLMNIRRLGLRARTFAAITCQLTDEVLRGWRKTRRRTFQAVLQFDVFLKMLHATQPAFSTFFTNHVASAMHRYWAAAFPEDYERSEFNDAWVARYSREIEFAMLWADRFFADLARFVETHPGYALWVATSMGQAAWNGFPVETQLYLADIERFTRFFGLESNSWSTSPAMLPDVSLFVTESFADSFERSLQKVRIAGKPIDFSRAPKGLFSLHFGQVNLHKTPQVVMFGDQAVPFERLGLECRHIEDETSSTGYHVKEGMLLCYELFPDCTEHSGVRDTLSTLDIAPRILSNYGLRVPGYMKSRSALQA
jgi:hypothetical protein